LANGGVLVDTAIATGGVPTGGDELVGLGSSGTVDWSTSYQNQDTISPPPVSDAAGNHYYVKYPGDGSTAQLIASRGAVVRWSKPVGSGVTGRLAVGANGQVYELAGNSLLGFDANSGDPLFTPLPLNEFFSGSFDRLFAYDQGLVIYSGYGKVLYVNYSGHIIGGPYTHTLDEAGVFERDIAASATGDLFVVWYDQALYSDGCLDADGNTVMARFTPSGLSWTQNLAHVSRCNHGGPYVAATPNGGAVVSGSSDVGATVQAVDASGQVTWRRDITPPADSGARGALPAHVDETGQVLLTTSFAFGCGLLSDICAGVQVSRFLPSGTPLDPILLKGNSLANQESWVTGSSGNLALTPGHAVLSLRHNDGGATFGTNYAYSVDGFPVEGVGVEYPQSALWRGMPPPADPLSFSPSSGRPGTRFVAEYTCRSGTPMMSVVNNDVTATDGDIEIVPPVESDGTFGLYKQAVFIGREGTYTASLNCGGSVLGTETLRVEQTLTYAGLGDSYSSGEGAFGFDGATPNYIPPSDGSLNTCHRAITAWPMSIRSATNSTIDFAACSGAVIDDFQSFNRRNSVDGEDGVEVPQRDHISPRITTLASLSVGGNDIGFPDIGTACVAGLFAKGGDCHKRDDNAKRDKDPQTTSISDALRWLTDGRPSGCVWLPGIAATGSPEKSCYDHAVPSLHALYQDLATRLAPSGRLVVTGYPAPFGSNLSYTKHAGYYCNVGGVWTVSGDDTKWLSNTVAPSLNKTILAEIRLAQKWAAANRPDITIRYAPDTDALAGHRLCDSSNEAWINGLVVKNLAPMAESFHPNVKGHAAIAAFIRGAFG
jgi:hypothetical protein